MAPTRRRPDITNQQAPASAPLTPPAADVPGYQHVFLFYFENGDYSQVIGAAKQAPYLNSLRRGGATLTNFYAEDHASDANYLALAGGGAFGVPLTDPEEENPLYCASHVVPLEELTSAASSYVCLGNDAAEPFVVGVVVAPDDVPADHAGLFGVAAMVGAVQREVPQRRELRFYAV